MKISISKTISVMTALFSFIIINIPSIKLIYSSEIINVIAVGGLGFITCIKILYLNKGKVTLGIYQKKFLLLFTLLWLLLLMSGMFWPNPNVEEKELIQYIGVYISVFLLLFSVDYSNIKIMVFFQIMWATLLSITQIIVGINLDESLGQHYLTLGVPIASGIVSSAGLLLVSKNKKVLLFFLLGVMAAGLASLYGRAPILFSLLTIVLFWLLILFHSQTVREIIKKIILFMLLVASTIYMIITNVNEIWLHRFERMSNPEAEPRSYLYMKSLELIYEKPFGFGLNAHEQLLGDYPHNIFLELFISTGLIAVLIFCSIVVLFILLVKKILQTNLELVPVAMLATYLFLTWNVSFNLLSSYIPFGIFAITISVFNSYSIKTKT